MLPIISGGHSAYQDTFVSDLLAVYTDPFALITFKFQLLVTN